MVVEIVELGIGLKRGENLEESLPDWIFFFNELHIHVLDSISGQIEGIPKTGIGEKMLS